MLMHLPVWLHRDGWSKRCGGCKGYLHLDSFHRDKKSNDGRVRRCKECVAARSSARYAANHDEIRSAALARYHANRSAVSARRKAARARDPESANARARAYAAANPAIIRAASRKWRQGHASEVRATKRAWDKANPLSRKLTLARYRTKLRAQRLAPITRAQLTARIAVFGDACAYCGEPWSHLDHVHPISRGGAHCLANLRPACVSCNIRKSNRRWRDWLASLPKILPLPLP